MKSILKNILVGILGWQVRRLRRRHDFKIVGVVGSIGKTSTKLAIAKVLASEKRVRFQEGNYNDILSVPLVFFGQEMPVLWNIFSWFWLLFKNELQIRFKKFPFDFVVVELGTDAPDQIIQFKKFLHLDVAVITAITPEHMEYFKDLKAVAEEEWSARFFSSKIFANRDLCQILPPDLDGNQVVFYGDESMAFGFKTSSKTEGYSKSAAVVVAKFFSIHEEKIKSKIDKIENFSGRMARLQGINNSTIIDDSYNASPEAVKMALQTLYAFEAPQRIAVLGMMNELGSSSETEHRKIGQYCDSKLLDLVVTIGKDANQFLAAEVKAKSCQVYEAKNSVEAGEYLKDKIKKGAVILIKGSQNGVFAEEAIKPLLADKSNVVKLVRQSREWLKKKGLKG